MLLEDAELWLERGEHVSLVGPNGSGKTTLIETLTGRRPLAAGKLRTGHNVKIGYLSQHTDELGAGGPGQRAGGRAARDRADARTGRGRCSDASCSAASRRRSRSRASPAASAGGCRSRSWCPAAPNVLILDEPTNHLDLESREALEDALPAFTGSLILVSHDRALLDAVGTRTVAVEDGTLHSYVGGWPEYVRVREARRAAGGRGEPAAPAAVPAAAAAGRRGGAASRREPSATARSRAQAAAHRKNRLRAQSRPRAPSRRPRRRCRARGGARRPGRMGDQYEAAKTEARHTAARRAVEAAYARLEALRRLAAAMPGAALMLHAAMKNVRNVRDPRLRPLRSRPVLFLPGGGRAADTSPACCGSPSGSDRLFRRCASTANIGSRLHGLGDRPGAPLRRDRGVVVLLAAAGRSRCGTAGSARSPVRARRLRRLRLIASSATGARTEARRRAAARLPRTRWQSTTDRDAAEPGRRAPRSASPSSGAACPISPASTSSATAPGASSTSARRSRCASASPRTSPRRRCRAAPVTRR